MCLHVWHRGHWQGNEPASVRGALRFRSCQYDTSGGSRKILRASGLEDKMLKLSSKIRTLVLVLSLWLVGVDVRSMERVVGTFLRSLLTSLSG